jgi:hypothetical protein
LFRGQDGVLTLHFANLGAGRKAAITGIPAAARSLRAIRTNQTESYRELAVVQPTRGALELDLALQSLPTRTTMRQDIRLTETNWVPKTGRIRWPDASRCH